MIDHERKQNRLNILSSALERGTIVNVRSMLNVCIRLKSLICSNPCRVSNGTCCGNWLIRSSMAIS